MCRRKDETQMRYSWTVLASKGRNRERGAEEEDGWI